MWSTKQTLKRKLDEQEIACKRQLEADEQEQEKEKQIQQNVDEIHAQIHLKKNSVKVANDTVHEGDKKLQHAMKKSTFTRNEAQDVQSMTDGFVEQTEITIRNWTTTEIKTEICVEVKMT